MGPWILGVDAGGSGTSALLWQYGSRRGFSAESGPGNPWAVGADFAADAIEQACAQVLAQASLHLYEVGSVVLGIAGHGRSGLPSAFSERVAGWGLPPRSLLTSDLEIAAVAGLRDRPGIHVVCGTGSSLMRQSASGVRKQLGGWGWFLGDPGSAFDLGRRALCAWAMAIDHGDGDSAFSRCLSDWAGVDSPAELQARMADPGRERPWIASAAKPLMALVDERDPVASRVLESSLAGLIASVDHAASGFQRETTSFLSFSGGMFDSAAFTNCFVDRVKKGKWVPEIVNEMCWPLEGALRLAQKALELKPDLHLESMIESHFA